MDPNAVVLEISSDEEINFDNNWIAEFFDDVNTEDYDDDSDEVVVVSEVLPSKTPRKKPKLNSSLIDSDDDCVILDKDPDKPVEVRNDDPTDGDGDHDSDDLVVVGEKGQVACRDYPHSRHLCIKFPFSSTPNENHCDQCYCYVCDSLAPCVFWGNGSASIDHCHATDKDEYWMLERKKIKNGSKGVQPVPKVTDSSPLIQLPVQPVSAPVQIHNQVSRPTVNRVCSISSNSSIPNLVNHNQSHALLARNKYQPGLVAQQLIRTNNPKSRRDRGHHDYNLGTPIHRPVFKRVDIAMVAPTTSSSYRDPNGLHGFGFGRRLPGSDYLGSSHPNLVNISRPFSLSETSSTVNPLVENPPLFQPEFPHHPRSNTQFDFSLNYQSQANSDSYLENPIPSQPHPISSTQPQMAYSETQVSSLSIPVSDHNHNVYHQKEAHGQSSTIHPNFTDCNIVWPPSDINQQIATESSLLEVANPPNGPSAAVSGGLTDYQYNNWIFDDQPVEAGSMDVPVLYGLSEFPNPVFTDTGTIFNF